MSEKERPVGEKDKVREGKPDGDVLYTILEGKPDGDDVFTVRELLFIEARAKGLSIKDSAKAATPPLTYITARRLGYREDIRAAIRKRAQEGASMACNKTDGEEKFTAQELLFIGARAVGKTIKASAQAVNPPLSYSTAWRMDDRADIRSAIRKQAREAVDCGVRVLATSACSAAKTLKTVAERGGTGDGPRVSAARAVLELSMKSLQIDELLERFEQLEARQGHRSFDDGENEET